jgi:hypothetical protein
VSREGRLKGDDRFKEKKAQLGRRCVVVVCLLLRRRHRSDTLDSGGVGRIEGTSRSEVVEAPEKGRKAGVWRGDLHCHGERGEARSDRERKGERRRWRWKTRKARGPWGLRGGEERRRKQLLSSRWRRTGAQR